MTRCTGSLHVKHLIAIDFPPPFLGGWLGGRGVVRGGAAGGQVARMERPVLLFDEITGNPTYLINGVQIYAEDAYTFTLTQAIER